jgi:hypothetical protein
MFINIGLFCGILTAVFAFAGSLSAVGSYFYGVRKDELLAIASKAELDQVRNTIHSFTASLYLEFTWEHPNNPLLETDQGGGVGEEDHLQLIRENPETRLEEGLWLKRVNPYRISKISDLRASFEVTLVPRAQGFPIGNQMADLDQIKSFRALVPVKNYSMNGRDNYLIQIQNIRLDLFINGTRRTFQFNDQEGLTPVQEHQEVLWGYLNPFRNFNFTLGQWAH